MVMTFFPVKNFTLPSHSAYISQHAFSGRKFCATSKSPISPFIRTFHATFSFLHPTNTYSRFTKVPVVNFFFFSTRPTYFYISYIYQMPSSSPKEYQFEKYFFLSFTFFLSCSPSKSQFPLLLFSRSHPMFFHVHSVIKCILYFYLHICYH